MNVRIVVKENTVTMSKAVNSSRANHVTCRSRESSSCNMSSTLAPGDFQYRVVRGQLGSSQRHVPRHERLEGRGREVEPVEAVHIVRMGWWKSQPSIAVPVDHVSYYRTAFSK